MRKWLLTLSAFFICCLSNSQTFSPKHVSGLPTDIIYDLLVDSKGFIWIGHSLGISRYDGTSFTNFNNKNESILGLTDLLEDKQGRIWCHNFNGQIFYIENEKMIWLDQYDNSKEDVFPRMTILGDELLATNGNRLFVCNTKTLKGKYVKDNSVSPAATLKALTKRGNEAYTFCQDGWLKYNPKNGLTRMFYKNETKVNMIYPSVPYMLSTTSSDTIFACYGFNILKFVISRDTVILKQALDEKAIINTATPGNPTTWIHCKQYSYTTDGKQRVTGYDLTDVVKDKEGNFWYSSLDQGLMVVQKSELWKREDLPDLAPTDFIRCVQQQNNYTIYCSQKGNILIQDNETQKTVVIKMPLSCGSVENIFPLSENLCFIAPSIGFYLLNLKQHKLTELSVVGSVKGIAFNNNDAYVAFSSFFIKTPLPYSIKSEIIKNNTNEPQSDFANDLRSALKKGQQLRVKRSYSICFDSVYKKLLVVFKDGLFSIRDTTLEPVLFDKKVINATSVVPQNYKVYVGTTNTGLLVMRNDLIKRIGVSEGLQSERILKIHKINDSEVVLTEPACLQVLNTKRDKIEYTLSLPFANGSSIYDVWEKDSLIYLATSQALFKISLKDLNAVKKPLNYLLSVVVNTRDTLGANPSPLAYTKNNFQFTLSSPLYSVPNMVYFKYRLIGGYDTSWQTTTTVDRTITFNSLNPGDYTFEAIAVNFKNEEAVKPISYSFTINRPWYYQYWFLTLVILAFAAAAYYVTRNRINAIKKRDQSIIENLHLQNELRKSLLATIKTQMNPHFIFNALNTIQSYVYQNDKKSVSNYMGKFSGLIRKILDGSNKQKIPLSEEIELLELYIALEKARFEDDLHTQIIVDETLQIEDVLIPPMLIQPYVENAINHGLFHKKGDKNLSITFRRSNKRPTCFEIIIEDDGVGINRSKQINLNRRNHKSFATSATERRLELINQTLKEDITLEVKEKENDSGASTGTIIEMLIPLDYQN